MKKKIIMLLTCLLVSSTILTGCKSKSEIKAAFTDYLSIYPTENLVDIFDAFEEPFIIQSGTLEKETPDASISKTLVLQFYPQERTAYGVYIEERLMAGYHPEKEGVLLEIPIMFDENGFHIKEGVEVEDEVRAKIRNFKFKFQNPAFAKENFEQMKLEDADYNGNIFAYSLGYSVTNKKTLFDEMNAALELPQGIDTIDIFMLLSSKSNRMVIRGIQNKEINHEYSYHESLALNNENKKWKEKYIGGIE